MVNIMRLSWSFHSWNLRLWTILSSHWVWQMSGFLQNLFFEIIVIDFLIMLPIFFLKACFLVQVSPALFILESFHFSKVSFLFVGLFVRSAKLIWFLTSCRFLLLSLQSWRFCSCLQENLWVKLSAKSFCKEHELLLCLSISHLAIQWPVISNSMTG